MEPRPFFTDPVRIALTVAILFAAASIGYFVAVLFHSETKTAAAPVIGVVPKLTEKQKDTALQALATSTDTTGRPAAHTLTATATPTQIQEETNRRLKVLQSLNLGH